MITIQKRIIIAGIKIKVARGEDMESILESYINLTPEEKQEIRTAIMGV
jgi:hypothetical protein